MTKEQQFALNYAKRIAYSTEETLMFTFEMAKKYADSPGCYVECGVAAGAQVIAMAAGAPGKQIWAFDSFQGIPLPSNKDNQMPGIKMLLPDEQDALPDPGKQKLVSSGATVVSIEDFICHMEAAGVYENVEPIPGWFEEVLPTWAQISNENEHDEGISILRLDGDLYNSTLVCLQNLYPLVVSGGILIIDDWQLPGCCQAVVDYADSIGNIPSDIQFVSNIAYFIKP